MDIDLIHIDFLYHESMASMTSQMNLNFPPIHPCKDSPRKADFYHIALYMTHPLWMNL